MGLLASEPGVRLSSCGAPLANSRCSIHPDTEKTHQEGCTDLRVTGICVPMEHSQGAPDSSLHYPPTWATWWGHLHDREPERDYDDDDDDDDDNDFTNPEGTLPRCLRRGDCWMALSPDVFSRSEAEP